MINSVKRQLMDWEKIFASRISLKGITSKIYRNANNSTARKQKIQLKSRQET
jgi:hypothetical protein